MLNDTINNFANALGVCYTSDVNKSQTPYRSAMISNKEDEIMFNTMNDISTNVAGLFNGVFGRIAPDMCRISMSGDIAIRTPNGYKSYNVNTGRLTNCSNFAFNIGEDAFFCDPRQQD